MQQDHPPPAAQSPKPNARPLGQQRLIPSPPTPWRARSHERKSHVVHRSARRPAGGRGAASPPTPPEAREVHGRSRGGDGHRGTDKGDDRQQPRGLLGDLPGAQRHVANQRRVGPHRPRRRCRRHARVRRRRTLHIRYGWPLYLLLTFPLSYQVCLEYAPSMLGIRTNTWRACVCSSLLWWNATVSSDVKFSDPVWVLVQMLHESETANVTVRNYFVWTRSLYSLFIGPIHASSEIGNVLCSSFTCNQ